jgi:hypothetical protein
MTYFPPKTAAENVVVSHDFSDDLAAEETILTQALAITTEEGTDASPEAIKVGSVQVAASVVSQRVKDGLPGVTYLLRWTITTSAGNTFEGFDHLPVTRTR